MGYVMSPSGLQTFKQCPLRFHGTYIDKSIPWKDSPSKARGTQIHAALERAVNRGWDEMPMIDSQFDAGYARQVVNGLRGFSKDEFYLRTEKELAITRDGKQCDWWAPDAFLRAKADVVLVPYNKRSYVILGDWKTGKIWDRDAFQLRTEALLCHIIHGVSKVKYAYWYVDQGETVNDEIDFSKGLADVQDVIDTMAELRVAIKNNHFMATPNKFCHWCPKEKTPECRTVPF